ncbi:MAG: undecaprenyl-diphosphate phosphatase [Bacilli bacterium]|jgi:undecaprenyl-diphosphatase|nr:undecaprenyl-diphosphate phosphatase [Bacilli bacterium]HHU23604.1 undecaprenyl-diphosphate phosphatase [Acholeplasmataceae bacterium]
MVIKQIIKYLLLGLVQGFTEPLPISSSAHLVIASHYLGLEINLNTEILLHFASFWALVWFFRKDLFKMAKSILKPQKYPDEFKTVLNLSLASLPIIILGFLFKKTIETYLNSVMTVCLFLLLTSVILVFTSFLIDQEKKLASTSSDSLIIGFFQSLAIFPGVSRSASTLLGAKVCKLKTKQALNFSFYLYLIASFGAFVLAVKDYSWSNFSVYDFLTIVVAFVSTLWGISFLHRIISKRSLLFFSFYTIVISVLVFLTK